MMQAMINYVLRDAERMAYFANDSSRDTVLLDPRPMSIDDSRHRDALLDQEGFQLVAHHSAVADFGDAGEVARIHPDEIEALLGSVTGADAIVVTGAGVRRAAFRRAIDFVRRAGQFAARTLCACRYLGHDRSRFRREIAAGAGPHAAPRRAL